MSCQEIMKLVSRCLDHALSATDQALLDAHIESCGHCRAFVGEMQFLQGNLKAEPSRPCPQLTGRIMDTLACHDGPPWFEKWYRPLTTGVAVMFFGCGVVLGMAMMKTASPAGPLPMSNPLQTLAVQFDAFDESSPSGRLLALWTPMEDKP